jgi:hypothetical protein
VIYQGGKTEKDTLRKAEMARLLREFSRWRSWNWSVWVALGACLFLSLVWLSPMLVPGGPGPSLSLWARKILVLAPALFLGVFQQFLFSRFTAPPAFRAFGLLSTTLLFLLALAFLDFASGARRGWQHEQVAYHCIAEPSVRCRDLMRKHPEVLLSFGEEERLEIRLHADRLRRAFEDLDDARKLAVELAYKDLLDAYSQGDFRVMLEKTARILRYVDDYNDTKSYEALAQRGLLRQTEERHRRAVRDRVAMIHRQVTGLEEEGDLLLPKARHSRRARAELETMIADIVHKEPGSARAAAWRQQLSEWDRSGGRGLASRPAPKRSRGSSALR